MGSKSVTIGYKYKMGQHQIICKKADAILALEVGERTAWTGNVTASTQIYVNKPNLFGGEKKEGGVQGYVDLMFGEASQAKNSYLQSKIQTVIPAFRGVVSAVLRSVYLCAMSPYPKPWAWKIQYLPGKTWYPAKADINSGSANPIHVVHDILTDEESGLGVDDATIDQTIFMAAADTLYNEGFGLSFALTGTDSIESVIYSIMEQIGAIFYTKPDDGLFAVKLLRDDYSVGSLPLYDEANIVRLENFERPSYAEMVNEIIVQYRKRGTDYDDAITVQNLASIQAQDGVVSETLNYGMIDNAANAARTAIRELKIKSTPLARVRFTVNRQAWATVIGDVVRFSWAEHNIVEMPVRVFSVDTGNLQSGVVTIDAVQDVFGLPDDSYIVEQPSEWTDPFSDPLAAAYRYVYEAPYRDLYQLFAAADFELIPDAAAYLAATVGTPDTTSQNYELWTRVSPEAYDFAEEASYAVHGTLQAAISYLDTAIVLENIQGDTDDVVIGDYAWIDDEAVIVEAFNPATGAVTVGRGTLDTVPATHELGARFYFSGESTSIDDNEYAVAETVDAKILTRAGPELLDLADAPADAVVMVGRFIKPYPPANLKIAASSYPSNVSGIFTVTWNHRDRIAQQDQLLDTTEATIGPESTTRYALRLLDASDDSLIVEKLDIDGATATVELNFTGNVKLILYSITDNGASYQQHNHQFSYTPPGGSPTTQITAGTYNPADNITIIDGGEVTP